MEDKIVEWIVSALMAYPPVTVPLVGLFTLLGTFSVCSTTIFKALHWAVTLSATDKDDLMVARAEASWGKLKEAPFIGVLIRMSERYTYIKR